LSNIIYMETIGSKRSYALTWCMPNNDDDDDLQHNASMHLQLMQNLKIMTMDDIMM